MVNSAFTSAWRRCAFVLAALLLSTGGHVLLALSQITLEPSPQPNPNIDYVVYSGDTSPSENEGTWRSGYAGQPVHFNFRAFNAVHQGSVQITSISFSNYPHVFSSQGFGNVGYGSAGLTVTANAPGVGPYIERMTITTRVGTTHGTFTCLLRLDVTAAPPAPPPPPTAPNKLSIERWASANGHFWPGQKWMSGDFNGDGLTDMINVFGDHGNATIDVHLNVGGSFILQRWGTQQGGFWPQQKWFTGDFNGDGRVDVAKAFDDAGMASIDVHISNPNNTFTRIPWMRRLGGYWESMKWYAGDFNGDGKDDCGKVWDEFGKATIDVHLSTGASFGITRWATQDGGYWEGMQWFTGDFNGDGKDDWAKAFGVNGLAAIDVHESTGSGSVLYPLARNQGGFWDSQRWFAGDFDGDGRCDVGKVFAEGDLATIDVHTAASGFVVDRWMTRLGWFWYDQQWHVGDFNGDGRYEPVKAFGNHDNNLASIDVHPHVSPAFNN